MSYESDKRNISFFRIDEGNEWIYAFITKVIEFTMVCGKLYNTMVIKNSYFAINAAVISTNFLERSSPRQIAVETTLFRPISLPASITQFLLRLYFFARHRYTTASISITRNVSPRLGNIREVYWILSSDTKQVSCSLRRDLRLLRKTYRFTNRCLWKYVSAMCGGVWKSLKKSHFFQKDLQVFKV